MSQATVAIPFSQEEVDHFLLAVRSVYAQTFQNWCLVLIGDNARSDLVELARAIADADDRVQCIVDGRGLGLAARLNQISSLVTTPYLARMDADDAMHPNRLSRQLEFLEKRPEFDLIASRAVVIDEMGSISGVLREDTSIPDDVTAAARSNLMTHPTVTGKTEWFQRNRYLTTISRAEDKELWLRTFSTSHFHKLDDALLYYRVSREFNRKKAVSTAMDSYRAVSLHADKVGKRRWRELVLGTAKAAVYATMPASYWVRVRSARIIDVDESTQANWSRVLAAVSRTPLPGLEN